MRYPRMVPLLAGRAVVLLALLAHPHAVAAAQEIGVDELRGIGGRARLLDAPPGTVRTPEETARNAPGAPAASLPTYRLVVVPGASARQGASVYGATMAFVNRTALASFPFQLSAGWNLIDGAAVSRSQIALGGKLPIPGAQAAMGGPTEAAVSLGYRRTLETSSQVHAALAVDRLVIKQADQSVKVGGTASLITRETDDAGRVDGGVVGVNLTWAPTAITGIALAYEFSNALSGEDSFVASFDHQLPVARSAPVLSVDIGKHRVVAARLRFAF